MKRRFKLFEYRLGTSFRADDERDILDWLEEKNIMPGDIIAMTCIPVVSSVLDGDVHTTLNIMVIWVDRFAEDKPVLHLAPLS